MMISKIEFSRFCAFSIISEGVIQTPPIYSYEYIPVCVVSESHSTLSNTNCTTQFSTGYQKGKTAHRLIIYLPRVKGPQKD